MVDQLGDRLLAHRRVAPRSNGRPAGTTWNSSARPTVGSDDAGVAGDLAAVASLTHGLVDTHLDAGRAGTPRRRGTPGRLPCSVGEHHALALGVHRGAGHVVQTQDHVLRRHDDRLAVGRRQHVVGGHHQRTRFQLGFQGQRHVHGHLVTVEVGVERGTDQRVQLDRLAFDQQPARTPGCPDGAGSAHG